MEVLNHYAYAIQRSDVGAQLFVYGCRSVQPYQTCNVQLSYFDFVLIKLTALSSSSRFNLSGALTIKQFFPGYAAYAQIIFKVQPVIRSFFLDVLIPWLSNLTGMLDLYSIIINFWFPGSCRGRSCSRQHFCPFCDASLKMFHLYRRQHPL
jgi:hypothetical protein